MKIVLVVFFLLSVSLYSVTDSDLSSRIIIDGYSSEFTDDEIILIDSLGNLLEYPDDSEWGEYNDVKQIKVTWDETNLYVAVDACSWDNNVILFFDIYDNYGITNMGDLSSWNRKFLFFNFYPDFFLATWDRNTSPQFWKVEPGTTNDISMITSNDISSISSYYEGNLDGSMEVAIPLDSLYFDESHSMIDFPSIKLIAVITGGDDGTSGPDVAPDNLGGMPDDSNQPAILDNYLNILIDEDGDDLPDIGIEPKSRVSFYKTPPFSPQALNIKKLTFPKGKVFAPSQDEKIEISIETNRVTSVDIEIYNLNSRFIDLAENISTTIFSDDSCEIKLAWDGKDKNGKIVPFGIYILKIVSSTGELNQKKAIAVIK